MLDTFAVAEVILLIIFAGINMLISKQRMQLIKISLAVYGLMRLYQIDKWQASELYFVLVREDKIQLPLLHTENAENVQSENSY